MTETYVDGVVTGVVVGPSGEDILLGGVGLHYVGNRLKHLAVNGGQTVNVAGVVDGGEGVFHNLGFLYGTRQACLQLGFEVGDTCIGGLEACAVLVAVFCGRTNGHDGSAPFGFVKLVGSGKKSLAGNESLAPLVGVVGDGVGTDVKTESEVLGDVELVNDTCVETDNAVVAVFILERAVVLLLFGKSPVEVTAAIEVCVVNATGTIAAPPVGEVQHHGERRAEVVLISFPESVLCLTFPGLETYAVGVVGETLNRNVAGTDAHTQQGREPLAYI